MERQIATTKSQSNRLLQCGVSAYTADMTLSYCNGGFYELMATPFHYGCFNEEDAPVWSLSTLLGLLPFKVHNGKYEYWLDIAPMDYGKQWSIGYYCTEKPRVIKRLTHTDSLIECAVQEIEWLTANGYELNGIEKGGSHGED